MAKCGSKASLPEFENFPAGIAYDTMSKLLGITRL